MLNLRVRKDHMAHNENHIYGRTNMKLTRRATRRIQLTVAIRKAEKEAPKLDYDKLMEYLLPI